MSYNSSSSISNLSLDDDDSGKPELVMDWTENPDMYRSLIEALPVAVYTCDADGRITFYNEAAAVLWGRRPELGKDAWCGSWKIYTAHGKPMPIDECPMAVCLREGRPVIGEEIIIERPDGTRRIIRPHPRPIYDVAGKLAGSVNTLLDITDDQTSAIETNRLAAIVESSDDAIISKTLDGIITSWNSSAERLFGYTEEEMIGHSILKLIPEDRQSEEPMIIQQLKKGERIEHFETKRKTKDGRLIDISLTISPVKDRTGVVIGASKIARDITGQKGIEVEAAKLAAIVQSSDDAIVSKNLDGIITSWNSGAERLFGYTEKEMIGQSILKLIPLDRHDEESMIIRRLKKGERVEHFETKRMTKDGKILDISLTISPIKDRDGHVIGASKIARDITAQKMLRDALAQSEERLRMASQATQLGTWEYTPSTGKLTWSHECRQLYQVPDDMEVDFNFFKAHIFPDDIPIAEEAIQGALDPDGDGSYEVTYRIIRYADKQPRWIKTFGRVYFDGNRTPERFIGTVLDITKEKEEEQELRESVELFQTMADNVPAMIWMSGIDKFNDYFNKAWLDFTGKTIQEERNEGWLNGVHPEDVEKCKNAYNKALKLQRGFYLEYRLLRNDGQYRWISDNCVPRTDPKGKFAGFISACIDIDDQKRFREKIQDSELLFKTISNASPVGLWMTGPDGQNTFVNDTWIEWTGVPFEKQVGQGWLTKVVEEDRINVPSEFRECLEKREKYTTEFRLVRQDGDLRWCLTEGYPFYDINGEFAGYAGSVTDITDIKRLEQRKDDFIKMASHELKTPITSIKGYVQLMMNIYDEVNEEKLQSAKPTVRSALQTISKQVTKLTRLVSELLDLTRIESGKLELHKSAFDPGILVEETVQDVRHTTAKHALIIHNDFEGLIYADRDRVGQVLVNLLTNAIKYSPEPGAIEVHVRGTDEGVSFSVKDHGIGIDKKEHEKIFERFYRVEGKNEQTYPGFGIGLFIAGEIIYRHGGTFKVESEKGQGSVFTFNIPFVHKSKT
jgi:PAS domain S-box-containing protein